MGPCYELVVRAYLQLGCIVEACQCWFPPLCETSRITQPLPWRALNKREYSTSALHVRVSLPFVDCLILFQLFPFSLSIRLFFMEWHRRSMSHEYQIYRSIDSWWGLLLRVCNTVPSLCGSSVCLPKDTLPCQDAARISLPFHCVDSKRLWISQGCLPRLLFTTWAKLSFTVCVRERAYGYSVLKAGSVLLHWLYEKS